MRSSLKYSALTTILLCGIIACGSGSGSDTSAAGDGSINSIVKASMPSDPTPIPLRRSDDSLFVAPHNFSNSPREVEPNDDAETATDLSSSSSYAATGTIESRAVDVFSFTTEGDPQLWYIEVVGPGVRTATLSNSGNRMASLAKMDGVENGLILPNVFLYAGTYFVTLVGAGESSEYSIRAVPLGPPDPFMEHEPNDDASQAHSLDLNQARTGYLAYERDADYYKFSLQGETPLQLNIVAPRDFEGNISLVETMSGRVILQGGVPDSLAFKMLLSTGHYTLAYYARTHTSRKPYSIRLDRLAPDELTSDLEPNNEGDLRELPADYVMQGTTGDIGADDWYLFPELAVTTPVRITPVDMPSQFDSRRVIMFKNLSGDNSANTVAWQSADSTYTGELGPGRWIVRIRATDKYGLHVDLGSDTATGRQLQGNLDVAFGPANTMVAAYWHQGQRLSIPVHVSNNSSSSKELSLAISTGNHKWKAVPAELSVTLSAGQKKEVPVTVEILSDAWDDQPVYLTAIASARGEKDASAAIPLNAECGIDPENPFIAWELPGELLGGFNVASARFGSMPNEGKSAAVLYDEMTPANGRYRNAIPAEITVDLAGEKTHAISGFLLHPQSGSGSLYRPRPFEISLSTDGSTFTKVLEDYLLPDRYEQAFVLPAVKQATHARLTFPVVAGDDQRYVFLGEWKVVAGKDALGLSDRFNIADPDNGGHIVWTSPYDRSVERVISGDDTPRRRLDASAPVEWVVGFHHERAARIDEIVFDTYPKSKGRVMTRFNVSVSLDSPTGPWTSIGEVVSTSEQGGEISLKPDQPLWARYVRVSNSEVEESSNWYTMKNLKIFEEPVGENTYSILAEWGHYTKMGPYEYTVSRTIASVDNTDAGDSKGSARRINLDTEYHDNVSVQKDVDWYHVKVPSGDNRLRLDLKGDPTIKVVVTAEDANGNVVELVEQSASRPHHVIYEAEVKAGNYFIRVEEPPRSVAFLWDNSGSVATYLSTIYQTMSEFGSGVEQGREFANWLPFGSKKFLLETWSDQPYELQRSLSDYRRDHSSSNSEEALLYAMREMEGRSGTKAIVMLTDALTFSSHMNTELWKRFDADRPRVFTLELHSGDPSAQDLMQSWANVDAGYYDYFSSNATLEVGFKRASCHIRRPSRYVISATTSEEAPPEDGFVFVALDEAPLNAVEIILDASGSMLQRIDGKRRIAIARDVLTDLVENSVPDGTPMALRVFGHRTPGECQTDLEVPLGPLDKSKVISRIAGTEAKNLAKTPIGASLAMVETDLDGVDGQKLILLITDGEETCDGDPAAAIETLKEKGLDIRVNIVGFAIDDQKLKKDFERWATAGGGRYFDAAGEEDLSSSVKQALLPKYQVFDDRDVLVGEGTASQDSLALPPGSYSVKILTSPAQTLSDISIVSSNTTTVNAKNSTDE